jgi:hypothetical protein
LVTIRELRLHFPEPRFWTVKSGFAPSGALSVNAAAVITSQR